MEKQKEIISITHFINPHLFWYHKIDACNVDYRNVLEIERELAEYYNDHQAWTQVLRRPLINAMVAVKYLAWNKIIRARVDHVTGFGRNVLGGEFVMWAVDYGFPFQTKADQIYRLPEKLAIPLNYVHCGGLANVFPADNFFMKDAMVKRVSSKWDQRACAIVEKAINDSEYILFIKEYSLNGQEWGELVIKTNLGVKFRVKDHLISLHLAADGESNFRKECLKLKTNKILPWMCNNGNSKFHTNRAYLYPTVVDIAHYRTKGAVLECDNVAKQKVEEWYERNRLTSGHENGLLDTTTEYTMTEGSIIDSMSVKKYDQQESDLIPINDHEEKQYMQLAGVLSKSRVEKYIDGKYMLPPLPENVDFEMKAGNVKANQTLETIETTESEISAIKYVRFDESTTNNMDILQTKQISNENAKFDAKTVSCVESIAEQAKTRANNTETPETNINTEYHQTTSVMPDDIESFAEYLIRVRNQYIERTSGKGVLKDIANMLPNEGIEPIVDVGHKFATLTKTNTVGKCELENLNTTFHGLRMIPAGYDFMNLHDYKDVDHWHCKKTTINDRVPHNDINLEDFANRILG